MTIHPITRGTAILTASLLTVSAATAAETGPSNGLRVNVGLEGRDFEADTSIEIGGSEFSGSSDEEWDNATYGQVQWVGSPGLGLSGGLLYGASLLGKGAEWEDGDDFVDYQVLAVRGHVGWGYAFTPGLQLEIMPFLGIGGSQIEFGDAATGVDQEESGTYWDIGADVNLVYTTAGGFQFGGGLGFVKAVGDVEYTQDTVFGEADVEISIDQQVGTVRLFAGYRF